MNTPNQPVADASSESLVLTLKEYFDPKHDAFRTAFKELIAAFSAEYRRKAGAFAAPEELPVFGGCGFVVDAVRAALDELELPLPHNIAYGLPKEHIDGLPPYHYWVVVGGQKAPRAVIDGAQPGCSEMLILTEEEHAARSKYAPYVQGSAAADSEDEMTLAYIQQPGATLVTAIAALPSTVQQAYYKLCNALLDDDTLTLEE